MRLRQWNRGASGKIKGVKKPEFTTEIIRVNPNLPEPDTIAEAAALLQSGEVVAFPTETVYGLGANALNPDAVSRIYEAKGRPSNNPLIVHVSDADAARRMGHGMARSGDKTCGEILARPTDAGAAAPRNDSRYCHGRRAECGAAGSSAPDCAGTIAAGGRSRGGAKRKPLQ